MAKNKVILVAGEAIKKEKNYAGVQDATPGMFVQPNVGGCILADDDFVAQVAVLDYTSVNGMDFDDTVYKTGDQVPILYPTNGCEVNVVTDAAITKGAYVSIDGGKAAIGTVETAIGVALSDAIGGRILMEVLK